MTHDSTTRTTAGEAYTTEDLRLLIADAEANGNWTRAGFYKSELLRLSRPSTTSRSESADPTPAATDVENLRAEILVAESARDWNTARELKNSLLRMQREAR